MEDNMSKDYLDLKGRIFDIQKFSIHDGPGIRTIVFLKGCFLRCRWCCNPESQKYEFQEMIVNGSIKNVGQDISVREVLDIVSEDRAFYRRSGGGITLSGGECFFQPRFTKALLMGAQERGINTAIETTSAVDFEIIESVLPYVDTFLMDIKHYNPVKHKLFTGIDNQLILENAKKIADWGAKLIVRVPIIPGFNDTEKEVEQIANFVLGLNTVKEIHLLPYHRLGQDKYEGLNQEYLMGDAIPPETEKINKLLLSVVSKGLKAQVGG